MSFDFLLLLDREHLDNGMFLRSLSDKLALKKNNRGIILHTDSAYTDRIIQTGVFREEAEKRSLKDLNNRLIALLADSGVPAIGLSGHKKGFVIQNTDGSLELDSSFLQKLPKGVHLVMNHLGLSSDNESVIIPFQEMAHALWQSLSIQEVIAFRNDDEQGIIATGEPFVLEPNSDISDKNLNMVPSDIKKMPFQVKIIGIQQF